MRGVARVDANQPAIVEFFRRCGCMVEVLSRLGRGVPDLLVGTPRGQLVLVEIKDPTQKPSDRRLTPDQLDWHREWGRYPIFVVMSEADAAIVISHECNVFDIDRAGRRTCTGCHRELAA